jgi:branched-subunit amino acid ABC-type transport system permease component
MDGFAAAWLQRPALIVGVTAALMIVLTLYINCSRMGRAARPCPGPSRASAQPRLDPHRRCA